MEQEMTSQTQTQISHMSTTAPRARVSHSSDVFSPFMAQMRVCNFLCPGHVYIYNQTVNIRTIISWRENFLFLYFKSYKSKQALTIVLVRQYVDMRSGVFWPQTASHRHTEGYVEALLTLIQRVINDHHTTVLFCLILIKAQNAGLLLWTRDVVRVGQNRSGDGSCGRAYSRHRKDTCREFIQMHIKCLQMLGRRTHI